MGLSKSKTVQKSDPWKPAQPYILKGLEQSSQVFDQQQPDLNKYGQEQRDTYGRLSPGAEQGITGAQGLVNRTINGDYLNGNPYLDKMLEQSRENTTDTVNGQFESSGRYGSGMHAGILAREIAKAEDAARYQNYAAERQNQIGAVGQASGLMAGSQSLLNNAAELPWIGVGALNGNIRQASNGYGTQTTTASPNWGQLLMQSAANAAAAYAGGPGASDRRLKTNIELIRRDPDGLGWYSWNWKSDPSGEKEHGVLADEVEKLRPWAFVPNHIGDYAGVNYGTLSDVPEAA
jgi:hypothetical protein